MGRAAFPITAKTAATSSGNRLGYFGCRNCADGTFNAEEFARRSDDQIKMVEPDRRRWAHHGGAPAPGVGRDFKTAVAMAKTASAAYHKAFSTPLQMMAFIGEMWRLSGGKPPARPQWNFLEDCMMLQTESPRLHCRDGNEGARRCAVGIMDHLGMMRRASLRA